MVCTDDGIQNQRWVCAFGCGPDHVDYDADDSEYNRDSGKNIPLAVFLAMQCQIT
jgi:hypothetical protein